MADDMHVPVLGLVENYSYVKCPDCGKEIKILREPSGGDCSGDSSANLGRCRLTWNWQKKTVELSMRFRIYILKKHMK